MSFNLLSKVIACLVHLLRDLILGKVMSGTRQITSEVVDNGLLDQLILYVNSMYVFKEREIC